MSVTSNEIWSKELQVRINSIDWREIYQNINIFGFAKIPTILSGNECTELQALYENGLFRSVIDMQRYSFGQGEYKYFSYPLPNTINNLRQLFYPKLVELANDWNVKMSCGRVYPRDHSEFITHCKLVGQNRPTPLILKYGTEDYNCLHQDLYGECHFPFQIVFCLNQYGNDYNGGEIVLVEQRPRKQSKASVITLGKGQGLILAVSARPVPSKRGYSKVILRHGVSSIHSGNRYTLGIIFHDAK